MENKLKVDSQWNKVVCIYNSDTEKDIEVQLEGENIPEEWVVVVNGDFAGVESLEEFKGTKIKVPKTTAMVLVDKNSFENAKIKADTEFQKQLINNTVKEENSSATTELNVISESDNKDNKALKTAGVVAGVLAAAAAVVTTVGVVLLKKKKKKK